MLCAWVLVKAHARSSKTKSIHQFINGNAESNDAMVMFSLSYGQAVEADYHAFCDSLDDQGNLVLAKAELSIEGGQ